MSPKPTIVCMEVLKNRAAYVRRLLFAFLCPFAVYSLIASCTAVSGQLRPLKVATRIQDRPDKVQVGSKPL